MTEREALQDIVCKVGVLTYGKERWFKQNGCWYDRMNCDYIQNETLVERVCTELEEEYADHKTENSSEKPNNCEHITEDGVTCAKYPACDDCLDNPLNKVKGSERLAKGSEQTEPTISKMEQVDKPQMGDAKPIPLSNRVTHIKDEPQTNKDFKVTYTCSFTDCKNFGFNEKCIECKRKQSEARLEDEPQTDCAWR